MMDVEKLFFLDREKMTSVYERKEIQDLPETAYGCFLHGKGEILYITDEGKLYGICSIGDLERFYREDKKELEINRRYTFLKSVDYDRAASFFANAKTVNEIPVITEENELQGVITYEKEEALRNTQQANLKRTRSNLWYGRELRRFINTTRAKVLVYTFPNKKIWRQMSEAERQLLRERSKRAGDLYWFGLSKEEWKKFWMDAYEEGIVDTMRTEMAQCAMVIENGVPSLPAVNGKCYHFEDGFRVTPNTPPDAEKRMFFYGPCIFLGAYCKDDQTIPYYLQNKLNENHGLHWKVINRGLFGPEYCYARMFTEELSENDIVIIGYMDFFARPDDTMPNLILEHDMSELFTEIKPITDYLIDYPLHCNYMVNQKIAERVYQDICAEGILNDEVSDTGNAALPEKIQDYYINWDVHEYFMEYYWQHGLCREANGFVKGAVIMNCNPFTKGHRYLIEQARGRVDKLYVFVVEEDKSSFAFKDRFRMVAQGVADLPDVQVIPSGKYILSKDTFAQYFEKENVETVENMDYDLRIFGEVVAKDLGIRYRFVGEEPLDQVTRAYNETMKRILPEYGVSVVEIPRVMSGVESGDVISATRVRKALEEKDWQTVERLCPESTVSYLKQMVDGEN